LHQFFDFFCFFLPFLVQTREDANDMHKKDLREVRVVVSLRLLPVSHQKLFFGLLVLNKLVRYALQQRVRLSSKQTMYSNCDFEKLFGSKIGFFHLIPRGKLLDTSELRQVISQVLGQCTSHKGVFDFIAPC
jgi:hypothetical protein